MARPDADADADADSNAEADTVHVAAHEDAQSQVYDSTRSKAADDSIGCDPGPGPTTDGHGTLGHERHSVIAVACRQVPSASGSPFAVSHLHVNGRACSSCADCSTVHTVVSGGGTIDLHDATLPCGCLPSLPDERECLPCLPNKREWRIVRDYGTAGVLQRGEVVIAIS